MQKMHHYGVAAFLPDFLALAETGSFHLAARRRNISQPAFSRRIQQLEQLIGCVLFDRNRQPIILTEAGNVLAQQATLIRQQLDSAVNATRDTASDLAKAITIATTHGLAVSHFPQWWKDYKKTHPNARARLQVQRTEQCLQSLQQGKCAVALLYQLPESLAALEADYPHLHMTHYSNDVLLLVGCKRLQKATPPLPFLTYAPNTALYEWSLALRQQLPPNLQGHDVFECPSSEVMKAMAVAGLGVAILPQSLVQDDLAAGFLIPFSPQTLPLHILTLTRKDAQ